MKKTVIEWRKATEEELLNGSDEMIIDNQYEVEVTEPEVKKIDVSNVDLNTLTDEQILILKQRFESL